MESSADVLAPVVSASKTYVLVSPAPISSEPCAPPCPRSRAAKSRDCSVVTRTVIISCQRSPSHRYRRARCSSHRRHRTSNWFRRRVSSQEAHEPPGPAASATFTLNVNCSIVTNPRESADTLKRNTSSKPGTPAPLGLPDARLKVGLVLRSVCFLAATVPAVPTLVSEVRQCFTRRVSHSFEFGCEVVLPS